MKCIYLCDISMGYKQISQHLEACWKRALWNVKLQQQQGLFIVIANLSMSSGKCVSIPNLLSSLIISKRTTQQHNIFVSFLQNSLPLDTCTWPIGTKARNGHCSPHHQWPASVSRTLNSASNACAKNHNSCAASSKWRLFWFSVCL